MQPGAVGRGHPRARGAPREAETFAEEFGRGHDGDTPRPPAPVPTRGSEVKYKKRKCINLRLPPQSCGVLPPLPSPGVPQPPARGDPVPRKETAAFVFWLLEFGSSTEGAQAPRPQQHHGTGSRRSPECPNC